MVKIMENPIKNGWFGENTHYFRKPPNSELYRFSLAPMKTCGFVIGDSNHVNKHTFTNISQHFRVHPQHRSPGFTKVRWGAPTLACQCGSCMAGGTQRPVGLGVYLPWDDGMPSVTRVVVQGLLGWSFFCLKKKDVWFSFWVFFV